MTREELEEQLLKDLPPIFNRKSAEKLTGGVINANSLRIQDCEGIGPQEGRFKRGRQVFYTREPFVAWLVKDTQPLV